MSAELALQRAIRARLISNSVVVALVPAASILDRHERPAPDPSIILGESQGVDEGTSIDRSYTRVYHTLHVWKREPSLEQVKVICGAIRRVIHAGRLALETGFHAADCRVSGMRYLRDPDGVTSHGVVTIEALVVEVAP